MTVPQTASAPVSAVRNSRDALLREAEAQRALADLFPHLKLDALRAIQDLFPLARERAEVLPASNAVH